MTERIDWVEIQEPRSGALMYANIKTGECSWEAPASARVKKSGKDQWWELYDEKTRRYYYYNADTKQTEWRKPQESDIIALAKLQNLKGKASKRRSSTSRKDSSSRRRSSSSRKEGEPRSPRDGERSLPRKYTRHNSGESLSQLRKRSSRGSQSKETEGHSSKYDVETRIGDGPDSEAGRGPFDETSACSSAAMKSTSSASPDGRVYFSIGDRRSADGDDNVDGDVSEPFQFDRNSDASMDLDPSLSPSDMETACNIEFLKISGEIQETSEMCEASFSTRLNISSPKVSSSSRTSNYFTNQLNYVSDGPLSESETSALNDSFHSCGSKLEDSNSDEGLQLMVTPATPTREKCAFLDEPVEIPRTTSFFNKMVDRQGNLRTNFAPNERSSKPQRHASDSGSKGQPSGLVLRGDGGGRRRSSSLDPKAYDNVNFSHSVYDNLSSDRSDDDDQRIPLSEKLRCGGMPSTTAALVEACEPRQSPMDDANISPSGSFLLQNSHSAVAENGKIKPKRPPPPHLNDGIRQNRPIVRSNTCPPHGRPPTSPSLPSQSNKYTELDLSEQRRRGLFGKKDNLNAMLAHSKTPIKKPVLNTRDKQLKKEALDMFKLVLVYMGDKTTRNKQPDIALWEIVTKAWANQPLRDELYFQLIKQTTDNSSSSSLKYGWELMAVCLAMFPPSAKYHSYLEGYVYNHLKDNQKPNNKLLEQEISNLISKYAENCQYKLEKMAKTGSRKGQRQPTVEEVIAAKRAIFDPSMFGSTLEDTMEMQEVNFPHLKLPWILTSLADKILQENGTLTEGIFRVPGDIDEVNALKVKTDNWSYPHDCHDPNVAASLLKQWFRDLKEPLIDESVYEKCIANCDDETVSNGIVASLPTINRLVLCYIIRFLQIFCQPDVIRLTKMDVNNLAMVWAPNFLRCPSNDPKVIFENTRKEMSFVRTLLTTFDTAFMEGIK